MIKKLKYFRFLLIIILGSMIFISCESEMDFPEVPKAEPIPVIEAILTDRFEEQKIRVSYTVPLNDSLSCMIVDDAIVYVHSDDDTIFYKYSDNGWYKSDSFAAKLNSLYNLEVIIDSVLYKSEGKVMDIKGIDSVYSAAEGSGYNVYIKYAKTGDEVRYIYANIFKNKELLNKGSDIFIISDEIIENEIKLKLPYNFSKNDTVIMDFYSVSKEIFDYYYQLYFSLYYTNYFNIGYKENPKSMFDKKAMGYFQVSSVHSETLIIH